MADIPPAERYRAQRLKIAFSLEGHGAATQKAIEWGTDLTYLFHVASTKYRHRSSRLEQLIDEYVRKVFEKHRHVLTLEPEE